MFKTILKVAGCLALTLTIQGNFVFAEGEKADSALSFKMKKLDGKEVDLQDYKGKVVLAVNVASRCGYTPQYADLQALYEEYKDKGLVILGFPCNQFGRQEPGSSKQIAQFCSKEYGVTFDMFEKVEVNGDGACDLYKHLTSTETKPVAKGKVRWNFEKFLIGRDGQVAGRYNSGANPSSKDFKAAVESLLAEK